MATELIINASLPETRIALTDDGEIQELLIERASGKGITGNIYKGKVTRVLPGMQAAFVDIGLEKAAFLYVDDVFVHSDIFDDEEGEAAPESSSSEEPTTEELTAEEPPHEETPVVSSEALDEEAMEEALDEEDEEDGDDGDDEPVAMGVEGEGDESPVPEGTISEESSAAPGTPESAEEAKRRRHRRGRRGGRNRRRERDSTDQAGKSPSQAAVGGAGDQPENMPEHFENNMGDGDESGNERPSVEENLSDEAGDRGRPTEGATSSARVIQLPKTGPGGKRQLPEFNETRSRDRRVRSKASLKPVRGPVNIQDLLTEGQEVLVQVAKDPIATKGARLTCHISLPGRHLVCMPTIDHVGVSRRIERDDERRKLRDFVERNRPKNLGFIVRTASGKSSQSEKRIKQDIDYLARLWDEIRDRASQVSAPALVYEDLNSVLRAIRDWVTEEIDKIIVDSRYHHQEILKFVSHFMPSLRQKIELYHGDIPIFDAYGISTELSRSLERKVWLKSGGYIVVDQAEALVAIDVNTGRYVGKKNLEDTILKTNLEAVQEIAYQLRLRNCGGIIILDLIDMDKEENKQRVYRALEDALRKDRARPSILKISELGLVEMTRKRTRDTIIRTLCEPCTHCEGKGFVKSKQTVAYEVMRELEREGLERGVSKILIRAHADVIDILAIDERETLDSLEKRYRKQLYLQAVTDFHQEQFEVLGDVKLAAQQLREQEKRDREPEAGGRERGGRDRNRGGRDRNRGGDRDRKQSSTERPVVPKNPLVIQIPVRSAAPAVVSANPTVGNPGSERVPSATSFEEEDRLAFLRAQAAQDAALAMYGANGQPAASGNVTGGRGGQDRGRGGRGRRGRGGKAPGDRNPGAERGPRPEIRPVGSAPAEPSSAPAETSGTSGGGSDSAPVPTSS